MGQTPPSARDPPVALLRSSQEADAHYTFSCSTGGRGQNPLAVVRSFVAGPLWQVLSGRSFVADPLWQILYGRSFVAAAKERPAFRTHPEITRRYAALVAVVLEDQTPEGR